MWNARLDELQAGIKIAPRNINNLRYAGEKAMEPHSSPLAWKIPWTEKPGRLQSIGSIKSRTALSGFTFTFHSHALEKEMATHSSVLAWRIPGTGEPRALYGVTQSWTWLKWLSSSRYVDDTTVMTESEEELKSLLMRVNKESEKAGLKLSIQKSKIMASCPIT